MLRIVSSVALLVVGCLTIYGQTQKSSATVQTASGVVVSFIGINGYGNNLYIDNICAGSQFNSDVAVLGLRGLPKDTTYVVGSGGFTVAPRVVIANLGKSAVTTSFDVTLACTPGQYTSTRTVQPLFVGEVREVAMDNIAVNTGTAMNVSIVSSLTSDNNRLNDTIRQSSVMLAGVQRTVLFEEATNTSCGPCAANNPSLDAFIASKFDSIVAIKYHAWWPSSSDPMYQANITQNSDRINYYNVNGVPQLQIDGPVAATLPLTVAANMLTPYNARMAMATPFTVSVTDSRVAGDSIVADVTVGILAPVREGIYRLRVDAVERRITYASAPGSNGEKTFYDVFRRSYPGSQGTALTTGIGTYNFQFRYKREPGWVDSLIYTAAFVQDDLTKEVMNCAKARHYLGANSNPNPILAGTAIEKSVRRPDQTLDATPRFSWVGSFENSYLSSGGFAAELFEVPFPPTGWRICNPDKSLTFESSTGANGPSFGGSGAACLKFYSYGAMGAKDTLFSPVITGLTTSDTIRFDWAYAKYPGYNDRLIVKVSVDGGLTYPFTIFDRDSSNLATATASGSFKPTSGQWQTFRRSLSGIVGVNGQPGDFPQVPALFQNYPNPFNPTTVVSYQLPVVSHVRLVVYDLLGREASTLVDERQAPGVYKVSFDASGLASGVYLYRISAGQFVQTRKMIFVK